MTRKNNTYSTVNQSSIISENPLKPLSMKHSSACLYWVKFWKESVQILTLRVKYLSVLQKKRKKSSVKVDLLIMVDDGNRFSVSYSWGFNFCILFPIMQFHIFTSCLPFKIYIIMKFSLQEKWVELQDSSILMSLSRIWNLKVVKQKHYQWLNVNCT